jgi:hypothetical protein
MISVLVLLLSLLCFGVLYYQHQTRKHTRRELFLMKRHAADYDEQAQRPVA